MSTASLTHRVDFKFLLAVLASVPIGLASNHAKTVAGSLTHAALQDKEGSMRARASNSKDGVVDTKRNLMRMESVHRQKTHHAESIATLSVDEHNDTFIRSHEQAGTLVRSLDGTLSKKGGGGGGGGGGAPNCHGSGFSAWFSEESGGWSQHKDSAMNAIQCNGGHCDNMRIHWGGGLGAMETPSHMTHWFSEENGGNAHCPAGQGVTALQCKGGSCDNIRLKCQKANGWVIDTASKTDSNRFSDENCGIGQCKAGTVIVGMHCYGSRCDDKVLSCAAVKHMPVDCKYGAWGEWGSCSATCGGGERSRTRTSTAEKHGGKKCEAAEKSNKGDCKPAACPTTTVPTTTEVPTTTVTTTATTEKMLMGMDSGSRRGRSPANHVFLLLPIFLGVLSSRSSMAE